MNDLEYLNSISPNTAQGKPAGSFPPKPVKIAFFALLGLIVVSVLALLLITLFTPAEVNPSADLASVYLRASSLEETVSTYNSKVKSPSLRAAGTTLNTILTDLKSRSSETLTKTYGVKLKSLAPSASEKSSFDATSKKLETARLNGILDRTYASEISYQISHLLLAEETALPNISDKSTIEYLSSSYTSLANLLETFSSFSE